MTDVIAYDSDGARRAARGTVAAHLAGGGIVVYPTETVYGLGCGLNPDGLEALSAFKGDRPFLLLVRDPGDVPGLRWTGEARRLADAFWPGPVTLALTAETGYPRQVMGPDGAVAVRVSPHPAIPDLLDAAGGPITSTSANRPGRPPAVDGAGAAEVGAAVAETGAAVLVLDGGRLPPGRPSTIVRCDDGTRLVREGAVSRSELESVVELR